MLSEHRLISNLGISGIIFVEFAYTLKLFIQNLVEKIYIYILTMSLWHSLSIFGMTSLTEN